MADSHIIQLTQPQPDIAVLTFDDPHKGANVLGSAVLAELAAHLDALEAREDVAGVIVRSGKPGSFIAGADLREFAASLDIPREQTVAMCQRGRRLFQRLSRGPWVTVAAVDGICVGGGAELAIWCDRRIMTDGPKSQFGFPEVKLGLFPGWGGTARASRILGLGNAVQLVTSGESIDGRAAAAMGLVSDVVPVERLLDAAIALVRAERQQGQYLADRQRWQQPVTIDPVELGFLGATASGYIQQQTKGHYPAPLAALEVILGAAELGIDEACDREAEGMAELFGSPENRALLNVFFLGDRNKKDTGVDRSVVATARPIKSVGVIGAGIMGAGIATANLRRELPVAFSDAAPAALAAGSRQVLEEVSYSKELKGPDAQRAMKYAALLNTSGGDAALANCDLVVEAVVENIDVKRQLFAKVEPQLRTDAILASNTSTIPIGRLAAGLARPEQFCGIHFFNPVRKMPLVEVIRGPQTSDETVATAVGYAKQLGKSPIVVSDGPGFLVNRLLFPYMNEAVQLLVEGVEIKAIERAAKDFGMPVGPITLYDIVGLDTAFFAGRVIWDAFPDRVLVSSVLPVLIKAGRLGQKSGRGFFRYTDKSLQGLPDPELAPLLAHIVEPPVKLDPQQITARLLLPMVLEATRALEEKLVRSVRDVDLGMIYGIGFPPFRGGLLFWADTLGARQIVEMLKPLEALGVRMQPTPLLLELAKDNRKFYDLQL